MQAITQKQIKILTGKFPVFLFYYE